MKERRLKPWVFGIAAGSIFVLAEAFLNIYPPSAYAFCLSCHVRDLLNHLANTVTGSRLLTTEVGGRAFLLTSPGVIIGALVAARMYGESKTRKASKPLLFALTGFVIMVIGIVIFGCPTRLALRAGYGDVYGIAGLVGLLAGVAVTTVAMRLWSLRGGR